MRLWSIHPQYLDSKGLVALWREGLLALHVLTGRTRGYKHHPQLLRFRNQVDPSGAINRFLWVVADEATRRGYRFNRDKLGNPDRNVKISVTTGQVKYEKDHLLKKLALRDPDRIKYLKDAEVPVLNPLFYLIEGEIEPWEKIS